MTQEQQILLQQAKNLANDQQDLERQFNHWKYRHPIQYLRWLYTEDGKRYRLNKFLEKISL